MADSPAAPRRPIWLPYLLLVLLAVVLWPPARHFLFVNEANNATVAQQVLLGGRLYADAADWKGPLGYLLYAAVLRLTGSSLVAVHLLGLLVVLSLLACTAALARRAAGSGAALPAAFFALVFLALILGPSLEMDLFMAFFSATAFLCAVVYLTAPRPRPLLAAAAGFLLVLALSCKQTASLDLLALLFGLALLARLPQPAPRARAGVGWLLLGAAAGLGLLALLIARYSTFPDYLAWAWIIPAAGQDGGGADRLGSAVTLFNHAAQVSLLWALALVAAVYTWRAAGRPAEHSPLPPWVGRLLPLWLGAGILGGFAGLQPLSYHLTQAAVPCAVLAAVALERLLHACRLGSAGRRYLAAGLVLALGLTLIRPLHTAAWRWQDRVLRPPDHELGYQIGRRLAAEIRPDQYLYVMAHDPSVVFWSGRRAASRYLMVEHLWLGDYLQKLPAPLRHSLGSLANPTEQLLRDLAARPPEYLLLPHEAPAGKRYEPGFQRDLAVPERAALMSRLVEGYRLERVTDLYFEYRRLPAGPED